MGALLAERRFKFLLTLRITCFEVMQTLYFGSCDLPIRGVQIRSESNRIRSDFGTKILISDWIGLIKLFRTRTDRTSIGRHFVSFLTSISCFYIYLVKYFHLNEKFILFKDSSDRIGILYQKSKLGSDSTISDRIGF